MSPGKSLEDLLGTEDSIVAAKMIGIDRQNTLGKVKAAIAQASNQFQQLPDDAQQSNLEKGKALARQRLGNLGKIVQCPACSSMAYLDGEQARATEPRLRDDMIVRDTVILPTSFRCYSCGLKLAGHSELDAAELGGQYQQEETFDPVAYYGADIDPADYYEPEYGND